MRSISLMCLRVGNFATVLQIVFEFMRCNYTIVDMCCFNKCGDVNELEAVVKESLVVQAARAPRCTNKIKMIAGHARPRTRGGLFMIPGSAGVAT